MRDSITQWAKELGFDSVGFTKAELPDDAAPNLFQFIDQHYHGEMGWLAEHAARRQAPTAMWDGAKSAIILGHNYGPDYNPLDKLAETDTGLISAYALNRDYHDIIKKKLKKLATRIANESGAEVKVFVDTAPLMEKPLASQSRVGWQGKHTCLVSHDYGSWLFLGVILTALELEPDTPAKDSCGSCRACLDICPTDAFDAARQLDARKCISYLTIEYDGHIAPEFRTKMGNRIYGCDDCLAICPWNKFAQTAQEAAYHARTHLPNPPLEILLGLDDTTFREMFRQSPVKRIGRNRFIRNALIAAGNSGNAALLPHITPLLDDASPQVRAMAVWASSQLKKPEEMLALAAESMPQEKDENVRNEWQNAIREE